MSAAHPTTRAWLVRADNPSPMPLEGTNSWVLVEPALPFLMVVVALVVVLVAVRWWRDRL